MQPPPEFYGRLLKQVRDHCNLTQPKLAELMNVDVSTIGRYERGWTTPHPTVILKLAKILNVDTINFYQAEPLQKFLKGNRIRVADSSGDTDDAIQSLDDALKERLNVLPQSLVGIRVKFKFRNKSHRYVNSWPRGWEGLGPSESKWLGLEPGATIYESAKLYVTNEKESFGAYKVFASGDKAVNLLDLADDVEVEVIGEWVYAVGVDWRSDKAGNDEEREYEEFQGFVVADIVAI